MPTYDADNEPSLALSDANADSDNVEDCPGAAERGLLEPLLTPEDTPVDATDRAVGAVVAVAGSASNDTWHLRLAA